jgi:hypothetical protein
VLYTNPRCVMVINQISSLNTKMRSSPAYSREKY